MIKKLLNTKISKENKKGFTLAELLIVVAIIGVLVAISIPIFTSQLEKSREATDAANIRSAYAAVEAAALMQDNATDFAKNNTKDATFTVEGTEGSYVYKAEVTLLQAQDDWQSGVPDIGGIKNVPEAKKNPAKATITYTQSTGETTLTIA
ncbi:MAG: prepilin-type N-terminal cleavage/methylation domain-containing protein [Lachnospiraceae bacterium]|nr:prepilin-type N-terminal cleavage/methylation domain-containing protein [Lachnospiraceae bacterium]